MKTLVLGPEEVREALDPKKYPKRHVFLVSIDGDIICCDVDEGWLIFKRPESLRNRQWCEAIKAAISAMQHHILVAKSIHDDIRETTEPDGHAPTPMQLAKVLVFEKGHCPSCGELSDPGSYPYCCDLHRRKARGC